MDAICELVRDLAAVYGPSGAEAEIRELIKERIELYVDEVSVDKFGNLLAHQHGKGPHITIFAHMDEIGLMVKYIDENGFMRFSSIGGIEPESLLAQQVHIVGTKGIVHGVISAKELHRGESFESYPSSDDMYIDVGLNSRKEVEGLGIDVGSYITPRRAFATMGAKNIISGKAMDNRVGCAASILLAKRMKGKKRNMTYAFTVEEEIGLYGAKTSQYNLQIDLGIIVDATAAKDMKDKGIGLSQGPVVTYKDEEFITNRNVIARLEKLLRKRKKRYQREVSDVGTTDAQAVSLSKGGVPTLVVSIPVRNIHSTISIADTNDIKETISLLEAICTEPPLDK